MCPPSRETGYIDMYEVMVYLQALGTRLRYCLMDLAASDSLTVSKYALLEVHHDRLLHHRGCCLFKQLVRGVVLDVVVSVVFRHEPQNKSVTEPVLQILNRSILSACD
jgi:hypothetical protein